MISGSNYNIFFNTSSLLIMSIFWQKDEQNIVYVPKKYRGTATNTLTLLNAEGADAGMYSLIVTTQDRNVATIGFNISIGK